MGERREGGEGGEGVVKRGARKAQRLHRQTRKHTPLFGSAWSGGRRGRIEATEEERSNQFRPRQT